MSHTLAMSRSRTANAVAAPSLGKALADLWQTLTRDFTGAYRPELHYMRGPGPKCQAKHTVAPAQHDLGLDGTLSAA
ncbi:MAG: hypothetical protein ABSG76_17800 [Xanthobacteraceae bacterium]